MALQGYLRALHGSGRAWGRHPAGGRRRLITANVDGAAGDTENGGAAGRGTVRPLFAKTDGAQSPVNGGSDRVI